ncbi:MAG: outer membrane beta-barrel protein [Prevotella sp.]|nr:outer membrane beta-barrel protein [Prevotella sp.]
MRRLTACLILMVLTTAIKAQDEPEYRLEVGAGAGTVTYLGDYNGNIFKGMQPWGALIAKYRMNPRMSMGLTVGFGKLKGSSDHVTTWYPQTERYEFDKSLIDVSARFEYNFWAYGTGREYRGAKRMVPFIALGLGAAHHGNPQGGMAFNIPIGAGIKYKVAERLNVTAEWRMHFTLNDKLDGQEDPYGIKSTGLFKNTDGFSILQVALTYDVWAKCKTCNSDRF